VSIKLVENEIARFLSTPEPEVVCIKGRWGVGKTFAWNRYLKDAQAKHKIALKRYSYVSLFGINSLDELKYSIFENSVNASQIGIEPSLETLQANTVAAAERIGRKSLWFIQQIPLIKNYVGGLGPVWFLSVKETIICVDDIERRGKNLAVRDVLGLISTLKENKRCKVTLILNDEALEEDEKDREEFRKYFEKVVDTSLAFTPSAEESAHIALSGETETQKLLAASCVSLGISNIRLIRRIERSVRQIEEMLTRFDDEVLKQAVVTLTLLGWSIYEPSSAPSLDYLQNRRGADPFGSDKDQTVPENEAAWNALLDNYGFSGMDEFDRVLLDGIRNGFFDPSLVEKYASGLNDQINAAKLDTSFKDAWNFYHDSFADNQEEVLDAIFQAFQKGAAHISTVNLNGTVTLFKELGRKDQAAQIIKHYLDNLHGDRDAFDLAQYPFGSEIKDPDVVKAFNDKYATFKDERNTIITLQRMSSINGWTEEEIKYLSTLPVDEYYKIFKTSEGTDLRRILRTCLQFDTIGNATEEMKEISKRAKDALRLIGEESAINARRVRKYGVEANWREPKNENEPPAIVSVSSPKTAAHS